MKSYENGVWFFTTFNKNKLKDFLISSKLVFFLLQCFSLIEMYIPFTDLGDPLITEEKDEVNFSVLDIMVCISCI